MFRNNLGFFWYELKIKAQRDKKSKKAGFNSNQLIDFQNRIKELNYNNNFILQHDKTDNNVIVEKKENYSNHFSAFQKIKDNS